jgi:hypothetical protein
MEKIIKYVLYLYEFTIGIIPKRYYGDLTRQEETIGDIIFTVGGLIWAFSFVVLDKTTDFGRNKKSGIAFLIACVILCVLLIIFKPYIEPYITNIMFQY